MTATGMIVTVAVADLVTSACDVTVTTTVLGEGADAGAVYRPAEVMVPQEEPVHPVPDTDQFTAVFVVPVTVSVNC